MMVRNLEKAGCAPVAQVAQIRCATLKKPVAQRLRGRPKKSMISTLRNRATPLPLGGLIYRMSPRRGGGRGCARAAVEQRAGRAPAAPIESNTARRFWH